MSEQTTKTELQGLRTAGGLCLLVGLPILYLSEVALVFEWSLYLVVTGLVAVVCGHVLLKVTAKDGKLATFSE
jgi:hypothetical protein